MTCVAPGSAGSVGNATYQLARAHGAGKVISTAGSAAKAAKARELGFEDVIDLSAEGLAEGVRQITAGKGVDIVIESIGGSVTSEALSSLALGGVLITLGYSAGRKTTIDFDRPDLEACADGRLLSVRPIADRDRHSVAGRHPTIVTGSVKTHCRGGSRSSRSGAALRHLIEDRPFGKVRPLDNARAGAADIRCHVDQPLQEDHLPKRPILDQMAQGCTRFGKSVEPARQWV